MKAWEIRSADGIDALHLAERPEPKPLPGQVLVQVKANSLNFRDLATVLDPLPRGFPLPRIPNSDGAGEVIAVGERVARWKVGDRVAGCFFQRWPDGDIDAAGNASALGGALDGMLAERVALEEDGVVRVPEHLSYEEAATLPCAALTAWNALVERGRLKAGETVLILGTGGVSVFALQLCTMMGARAIVTSSSDAKLEKAKAMGAWATVNYARTPEWDAEATKLTGGRGVDHVVEVGGAGTLPRSLNATRISGHVALIGVLTGGQINPAPILRKSIRVSGIYVGSRRMFEDMNRAVARAGLKPAIDRSFPFAEAPAAFHHLKGASHFGKVTIAF